MALNYDKNCNGLKKGELIHNGQFEIIKQIGYGGFGFVYSAHDNDNRGEK